MVEVNEVGGVGAVVFLVLCVVVFRALASTPSVRPVSGSAFEVLRIWCTEVVDGARTLVELDAVRRGRLDRPPWTS